ncbi:DUF5672 family protein [Pectinatus frisingensis]|uniref:DUF5672 family protein n=1 Tax=Pectinatus frisingensis TaxID=865 RepID=UPI0018C521C6|nr:DUF5672 family protein [Pectinatus frisingensis]
MEKVAIVIPIYTNSLTLTEKASLQQVKDVLKNHKIIFIIPNHLVLSINELDNNITIERFDSNWFINQKTYSKLLLTKEFYCRFNLYEYILIYQLDAFVFSDCLLEFCSLSYDYIGALCEGKLWNNINCQVGNGGLSLRNVQSCQRMILQKKVVFHKYPNMVDEFETFEDLFFSACNNIKKLNFKVANAHIARRFSAQYELYSIGDILPFGCHGWIFYNYYSWYNLIMNIYPNKYKLPEPENVEYIDTSRLYRVNQLLKEIKIIMDKTVMIYKINSWFHVENFSIWGLGNLGVELYRFLKKSDIKIQYLYDEKGKCNRINERIINIPTKDKLVADNSVILIGTVKDQLIVKNLINYGKKEGNDFYRIDEFLEKLKTCLNIVLRG